MEFKFEDDLSHKVYEAGINAMLNQDGKFWPEASMKDLYVPDGICHIVLPQGHINMMDCGAYIGDTLVQLTTMRYPIYRYMGIEADPANFAVLEGVVNRFGPPSQESVVLPFAVGSRQGIVRFASVDAAGYKGVGSIVNPAGNHRVFCVKIDDISEWLEPNYIKMDIESSEPEALRGAVKTIEKYSPDLAISVYHTLRDMQFIPQFIHQMGGYRMWMRCHEPAPAGIVLYATRRK